MSQCTNRSNSCETLWTSGFSSITARDEEREGHGRNGVRTEIIVQEAILPVQGAAGIPLGNGGKYLAQGGGRANVGGEGDAQGSRHAVEELG